MGYLLLAEDKFKPAVEAGDRPVYEAPLQVVLTKPRFPTRAVPVPGINKLTSQDLKELLTTLPTQIPLLYHTDRYDEYVLMRDSLGEEGYISEGIIRVKKEKRTSRRGFKFPNDERNMRKYEAVRRALHFSDLECWVLAKHWENFTYYLTSAFSEEGEHLSDSVEAWAQHPDNVVLLGRR